MGSLVDGQWRTKTPESEKSNGAFKRQEAQFRKWVTVDGAKDGYAAEPGRYHLYVSYACPWAHRTLILRSLRGLEDAVGVTVVDPKMGPDGWSFGGGGEPDPILGARYLRDVYVEVAPRFTGHVTVPVLWDKRGRTIVNNESREIMRMLDTAFDAFARGRPTLCPPDLAPAIDEMITANYGAYNNAVYRAGFARSQDAYDEACRDVFATLDRCEELLSRQRYLCGDRLTEADVAFFTTSLRFDLVYYSHFKCNVRRLQDYPNVWGFVRDLYQMPEIKRTCRLDHIKVHYYWSQTQVNPHRIVPLGPTIDYEAPHQRAALARS